MNTWLLYNLLCLLNFWYILEKNKHLGSIVFPLIIFRVFVASTQF